MRLRYQIGRVTALIFGAVFFILGPVAAQEAPDMSTVLEAFTSGDAEQLLEATGDRIEIALLGEGRLYSKAQATYVMEDFFESHPPVQFTLEAGYGGDGSWIVPGEYWYRQAEAALQVYVRLRLKAKKWEVREIHIEQKR